MIKNSPNDVIELVKIANILDENGYTNYSDALTKVAETMLYKISEISISEKEQIMNNIINELNQEFGE